MIPLQERREDTTLEMEIPDGILLKQSMAGDEQAFEMLVNRYSGLLLAYIQGVLKDSELANDVLQYVLLQFYLAQSTLRTDGPVRWWLFQVAYHRCVDELRKRKRAASRVSELPWDEANEGSTAWESIPDPWPLPEEIVEQQDLRAALEEAIRSLPPGFRQIVHLRGFGQLPFAEIASRLQMPMSTVKTYYYRSLPWLRSALANSVAVS